MKTILVELSSQAFLRLSRHAMARDTTAEKLAARLLCGAYCADEHDEPELNDLIAHGFLHADPGLLDTDDGVRAYYDHQLEQDED